MDNIIRRIGKYMNVHAFYSVGKPSKKIRKLQSHCKVKYMCPTTHPFYETENYLSHHTLSLVSSSPNTDDSIIYIIDLLQVR